MVKTGRMMAPRSTPSLFELKSKWFIPTDGGSVDGIPCHRAPSFPDDRISTSTDGNTVLPLIDGKDYMQAWRNDLRSLHDASHAELYHAGWRFEGMNTLGAGAPETNALDEIIEATHNGVSAYVLVCFNVSCLRFNGPSIRRLRLRGIQSAYLDRRIPFGGSNHQKFSVMKGNGTASAIVGSVDIARTRWDTPDHLAVDPNRDPKFGMQTHEASVRIEGPAVTDLEKTFRQRWNDRSMRLGTMPVLPRKPRITSPISLPPGEGTHSIQVLRTYGITAAAAGYSWSPVGEFTVWVSHLNAIKRASSYIYIEDQYFLPFDWPPCFAQTGVARETDLVYQLGEAMKRGVNVVVVTTSTVNPSFWGSHQKYQRDVGINYLRSVRAAGSPGDVVAASLQCEESDIYVHSKLMLVDDEFVSIGSANIAQRSMAIDSELHLGIVDEANLLARDFRLLLWQEHTGAPIDQLCDQDSAFHVFKTSVEARLGHLKPYPVDPLSCFPSATASKPPPRGHAAMIRRGVDPYAGPRQLRAQNPTKGR